MSEVTGEVDQSPSPPILKLERERHNFGRGEVSLLRATPEHIKEDPATGKPVNPVLFSPGYGGERTLEWYVQAFSKTGREALGVAYEGERAIDLSMEKVKVGDVMVEVPKLQVDKTRDMIAALDEIGIEELDMVSNSEGTLRTMLFLALDPKQRARNVVLTHPASMDQKGSLRTHARVAFDYTMIGYLHPRVVAERFKRKFRKKEAVDKDVPRESYQWKRAIQKSVGRTDLTSLLPALQKENPDLRTTMVADRDDHIFRPKRLRRINEPNVFKFLVSKWGGHGIGMKQERVDQIDGMLTKMDASRSGVAPRIDEAK